MLFYFFRATIMEAPPCLTDVVSTSPGMPGSRIPPPGKSPGRSRQHFAISIPDGEASTLVTVGKLHAWVVNQLQRLNRPAVEPSVVFDQLRELICDQVGISPR